MELRKLCDVADIQEDLRFPWFLLLEGIYFLLVKEKEDKLYSSLSETFL